MIEIPSYIWRPAGNLELQRYRGRQRERARELELVYRYPYIFNLCLMIDIVFMLNPRWSHSSAVRRLPYHLSDVTALRGIRRYHSRL